MTNPVRIAAALALSLALVPASSAATEEPWRTHGLARGGSISLPPTWRNFTRSTPQLHAAIRREAARNPRVAPLLYALTARTSELVRFVGADLARQALRRGVVTTLNVLAQRTTATLDLWAATNVAVLRRSPSIVKPVRRSTVLLPAGRAARLRYVQRLPAGSPIRRAAITQYALARDGIVYLLTYTTVPRELARYRAVFDRSARSFRLR